MKRRRLLFSAILLSAIGLIGLAAFMNLPRFFSYVISRATNTRATVARVELVREGTSLDIRMGEIRLDGDVTGVVKRCDLVINVAKGIYFENIRVADFDAIVNPIERQERLFTFPAELIEMKNGALTVSGHSVGIDDVKVWNVNIGDKLKFEAHVHNGDYIGAVEIRGEGTYNKRLTDLRGDIEFSSFNLARIDKILKGTVNGAGTIAFKDNVFTYEGKAVASGFELSDTWLDKPLAIDKVQAEVWLSAEAGTVDLKIREAYYKQTPLTLNIRLDHYKYASLELTSDYLDVEDVAHYATSGYSLKNVWDALKTGKVRAVMLRDEYKGPTTAELEIKDVGLSYRDMYLNNIKGRLSLDTSRVNISDIQGTYKTSAFNGVNGTIPYNRDKAIKVSGRYTLNLKDMPSFVDLKGLRFSDGTTGGSAEVEIGRGSNANIRGSGQLTGGKVSWKETAFSAHGSYKFLNDEVTFDPLIVDKEGTTQLMCKGTVGEKNLDFTVRGMLDTGHIRPFVKLPIRTTGILQIDGSFRFDNGLLAARGDVNMDDLAFEIPPYVKKEKGVKSQARVSFSKKETDVVVDDFTYQLDIIRVSGKGVIKDLRKIDAQVSLDAHDVGRVADMFFLPQKTTKGDVSLNVAVKDLQFPLEKLPNMTGYLKIEDGSLRIPGLSNPLDRMNLLVDFQGSSYDLQVNGLACGTSEVKRGRLRINGLENPQFSLSLDMDRFDLRDFAGGRQHGSLLIPQNSILARANGDLSLKAREAVFGRVNVKDLDITGVMVDRKISISECRSAIFDGRTELEGIVDLSGKSPYVYVNGRLDRIKSGPLLEALGNTSEDIVGSGFIYGDLKSEGDNRTELIGNLSGNVTVYSENGIIRKWNLLSKIFGLLNVYDLLKGKVNFNREGLKYNKLGGAFAVNKGVFNTTNFLLDSSSMVITGKGDLNLNKKDVNATLQVSPLIAIDRTIDKIPIVRSILKQRGKGFLYVTYNVKGPLIDPDITPSLTSTIGGKALEILRNILVLPREVFEK
ncbi:MAG TPA: AsmA-like C-terminal region-containing protein [Syntrophorhabdaceae bacterium]|nr:AsmA-like C-terminal region-containing protein [Syntrophorhabdaceae bacterium]